MATARGVRYPVFLLLLVLAALAGVLLWLYLVRPAPGPLRLTVSQFSDLPGWSQTDPGPALSAFRRSCAILKSRPAQQAMTGVYAGTAGDWRPACAHLPAGPASAASARGFFERWFTPFQVSAGRETSGLFTGYYEPELKGSRTRHGIYQTPVYGLPDDLVTVDLGLFRDRLKGEAIAGRLQGHALVPYPARAQIDAHGLLHAKVLFYAADPVSVFFLHIQGSGRVAMEDGSLLRVAYAGQNGRPYTAIGRTLMARGVPRDGMSMQVIRAWLKANPGEAKAVMETDQSYVFFKTEPIGDPALGARGAEGVPLTPKASLAVDPRLHALGAPFFVATRVPDADAARPDHAFDRLLVAQDTGGAIAGPVRGDIFFGFGAGAQAVAGRMKADGTLYVLLPNAVAARLGEDREFPGTEK